MRGARCEAERGASSVAPRQQPPEEAPPHATHTHTYTLQRALPCRLSTAGEARAHGGEGGRGT